jgi:DNA-binding LacI/PurR family transcriptional regulator
VQARKAHLFAQAWTPPVITLEGIARKARVSHSTVSRALADSPLVNAETKRRIQELARDAGYQVNQVARNLKVQSTRTVGLIVPEVSNPFYPVLVQGVADRAREAGFSLQLQLSGADQEGEAACLASLREQRVDGIVLVTAEQGLVARDAVNALAAARLPIVLLGWVPDAEHVDLVTGDDAAGGYALARHLIGLGHRRIAILGKRPHRGAYDRLFGFQKALGEAGIALPGDRFVPAKTDDEVRRGVRHLLGLLEPPTAVFAYQDSLAALAYKHLGDACVRVPQDVTVVGFDNLDLATYICPRLTTVGGHIEPLATAAVNLLVERIREPAGDAEPRRVIVTPRLVVRDSCAAPRATAGIVRTASSCDGGCGRQVAEHCAIEATDGSTIKGIAK